jgi:hypothetical protein
MMSPQKELNFFANCFSPEGERYQSFSALWNGKTDKITRSTLICDYLNGGLKMPHIQSFIHALKVSWIKKILDPMNQGPWKVLISDHLDASGGEKLHKLM